MYIEEKRRMKKFIENIIVIFGIIITFAICICIVVTNNLSKNHDDSVMITNESDTNIDDYEINIRSKYDVYDINNTYDVTGKVNQDNSIIIKKGYGVTYYDEPKTMWITKYMNIRTTPSERYTETEDDNGKEVSNYYDTLPPNTQVTVIGECATKITEEESDHDWYVIYRDGKELYMANTYCVDYDPSIINEDN